MFPRTTLSGSLTLMTLIAMSLLTPTARADIPQRSIDRATAFLDKQDIGKDVCAFVHLGATYKGHTLLSRCTVTDENGRTQPDRFALVYRFNWDDDGFTNVAFFFDANGAIYQVRAIKTNAVVQQPFAVADLTIRVLGDVVLKAFGDNLKPQDRADLQKLIDESDSHGLLVAYLRFDQILK